MERAGQPLFLYEKYTHGINPESVSLRIYDDCYALYQTKDISAGEVKEKKAKYLPEKQVKNLKDLFLEKGFLDVEPLSMPALYGGVVITITFNYEGNSKTIKFLKGTKISLSLERCWDGLEKLVLQLPE